MKRCFLLLVSAALVAIPASAHAESGAAPPRQICEVTFAPNGVSIPANVPALVVKKKGGVSKVSIGAITPPRESGSFQTIAEGLVDLYLPKTPFEVGSQTTIEWQMECDPYASPTTSKAPNVMTFTVAPAVSLPTTIGTVTADDKPSAHSVIHVQPSAELDAFLPVTRFTVRYNGYDAVVSDYGDRSARGPFELLVPPLGHLCGPGGTVVREATLEVRAHVAGATSDPEPAKVNALFDCGVQPSQDGGADDAVEDTSAGGCQTAPAAAASSFLTLALGLVVAGAMRRLRKRR